MTDISSKQLSRAARIKGKIERLQVELEGLLGGGDPVVENGAPTKRRKMSAAAKRKISAAAKARWAKVRAGKKK